MPRKRTITILVALAFVVLVAILIYFGGGWLAKMIRAHMEGGWPAH